MTRTALDKLVFIIGKYNLQQFISAKKKSNSGPSVLATKWHTRNEGLAIEIESKFRGHYSLAQHAVEINALVCAVKTGCVEQILTSTQRPNSVLLKQFSHEMACAYNLDFNLALWAVTAWVVAFGRETIVSSGLSALESSIRASGRASIEIEDFGALVTVNGGEVLNIGRVGIRKEKVSSLAVSRYQTTWAEWNTVRAWAVSHGYDIIDMIDPDGSMYPVHSISWYDAVKWCNARSEMEGLMPAYTVKHFIFRDKTYKSGIEIQPAIKPEANGYRLPTDAEWTWFAQEGNMSQKYLYSGSNTIDEVAWFFGNTGRAAFPRAFGKGTRPVGIKKPNILGLYDMSGNVYEWCWDGRRDAREIRGGCWWSNPDRCTVASAGGCYAHCHESWIGFRVVRSL